MDPLETVTGLARFPERASGSNSERRAGRWLQARLREAGRGAQLEVRWVRPLWPVVHAFHAALGVVGSVIASFDATAGLAVLGAALVATLLDATGRVHLVRRLTPQRATQNVISAPPDGARPFRLVVTAAYDAPRSGMAFRDGPRRGLARVNRFLAGRGPGPFGLMVGALVLLVVLTALRRAGLGHGWVGPVQLAPTILLLVAVAVLVDVALSRPVTGAADPASGAAVALALVEALDRSPPRQLAVELLLAGAGDGPSLGIREYVRARRESREPSRTIFLHVAACGSGEPCWWTGDGPLLPLRFHPRLVELAREVARADPRAGARPHRGHWSSGAYPARAAGFPAITVGCLNRDGWPPHSRQHSDTPDRVDPAAIKAAVQFCLGLVGRLDADLASRAAAGRS